MFWTDALIWIAAGFFVLAYALINQVWLRIASLLGSLCYVAFYMTTVAGPLWSPAITNGIIALVNVAGLIALVRTRSRSAIPAGYEAVYDRFAPMPPGDFRALIQAADVVTADTDMMLTKLNADVTVLYYVLEGHVRIEKENAAFEIDPNCFIGELALLTDLPASATTTLTAGGRALAWTFKDLKVQSQRGLKLRQSLDAAISRDMAKKIRLSNQLSPTSVPPVAEAVAEPARVH